MGKLCLDSRQIYQEMSIGTAQPTIIEQQDVSHHLINILPINETVSAGSYATLVKESIANIIPSKKDNEYLDDLEYS